MRRRYFPLPGQEMSNDSETTESSSSSDESETTKSTSDKSENEKRISSDDDDDEASPEEDTIGYSSERTTTDLRGVTGTRKSQRIIAQRVQQNSPRTRTTHLPIPKKTNNSRIPAYSRKRKPDTTTSDSDGGKPDTTTSESDDSSMMPRRKADQFSHNVGPRRGRNEIFQNNNRSGGREIRRRTVPSTSMPMPQESFSSDSDDSTTSPCRKKTARFSHIVGQRRGINATFLNNNRSGRREIRRRTVPSTSMPMPQESFSSDSDDSTTSPRRKKTARFSHIVGQRRGRNATFQDNNRSGRQEIRRRTIPSTSMPMPQESSSEDSDGQGFEIIGKAEFREMKHLSKAMPSTNKYDKYETNDKAEFRKMKHLSKARPSTNKYDKYKDYKDEVVEVDVNEFMLHSKSHIGASSMKRPYKGRSYGDTESDELPVERRDRVDTAPAKGSFCRKNAGLDAASSAHRRRNKMYGESVNDNIIARQNEELSSGIASLTRLNMMSEKKTAEVVEPAIDLSDESSPSSSDRGYGRSGRDDPAVMLAYVSDISDSQSSYSEKDIMQNNIITEELTKEREDCYGMERNSNTHVSIPTDDGPNECEKQNNSSSKENAEKEYEMNYAPQENAETNTIVADKATLAERLQVNSNGERGGSLKHVSNEHRNQGEEKERAEAFVGNQKVPLLKKQNGEKARKINEASEKYKEINTVRADDVTNEKLHVKNNVTRKNSTIAPYSNTSPVSKGVNMSPSKNQSRSDTLKQANAVSPALSGERLQVNSDDKGNKSPAAPCSNQPPLAKKCSEADGINTLQSNQSRPEMLTQANAGSPVVAEDKDTDYPVQKKTNEAKLQNDVNEEDRGYTDNGVPRKTDEGIADDGETLTADQIEKRRKLTSSRHLDLFKMLGNSVLERAPLIESESRDESTQAPTNTAQNSIPLKFRFEDEIPEKAEKTEFEEEFEELKLAWEMVQGSSNFSDAHPGNECSPTDETQDAKCARGLHELALEDDEGLYCIYCHHVELGPEDILPDWVQNTRRKPGTKRLAADKEDFPVVGEPQVESSVNNDSALKSTDDGTVWSVKPGVRKMYKHQQDGFEFLWKNLAGGTNLAELKNPKPNEVGGCIISHAPGTGKTRLTIVFMETYMKVFPECRPVIIAPAGMLLTWEEEFEKWEFPFPFNNLNDIESSESKDVPKQFGGPGSQDIDTIRMLKIFQWNKGGSVLGISYSLFARLSGAKQKDNKLQKSKAKNQVKDEKIKKPEVKLSDERIEMLRVILLDKPGLIILDEGHTPRNQSSNIWNVLLKLKTEKRVILSGTPFQNNFGELFNTLQLVRPAVANVIANDKAFTATSRTRQGKKRTHDQTGPIPEVIDGAMLEKLKSIMSPFVNVHKGTILQENLFGLKDSVIQLKPQGLQECLIKTLEGNKSTFEFDYKVALISVHPCLLKHCGSSKKQNLDIDFNLVEASKLNPNEGVKTKFIIELLKLSMAANEKVLIFGQYIQPLELIKEQLKEVFKWVEGKQILQMKGKQMQKIRQQLMKTYNDPLSEARVMLASTKCCSEGISLVGASRVVLLDVVWNPSVERQAICRAYRLGQKKCVYTYHLMTSGTSEGDKYCRQAEKERLSELVFCSSDGESDKKKIPTAGCIEDKMLEKMVGCAKLTDMFEKIIHQPKETDLIQTFGL